MHVVHVPWVYLPCQEGPGKRREEHVRSVPPGDQRGRPERQRPHYPRVEDQPAHHLGPGRTRRVAESGHPWLDELLRQVLPDRDVRAPAPHKHLLVRWARRKFKRLRAFKRAKRWWNGLLQREPQLFAHWAWMPEF